MEALFAVTERLQKGLPFGVQRLHLVLDRLLFTAVSLLFKAKLSDPLRVLPEPLLQLLLLLLQGGDGGDQLLTPFATALLFLNPCTGSPGNV